MTWLPHILGIDDPAGRWYAWWSGIGSDFGEVTIVGAILGTYYKHTCHQERCWRIGRHAVDGTPWCNRHHQAVRGDG